MRSRYWQHGRPWAGQACAIFGGGPTLTQHQVDACRGVRTIAINNAYLLAPWADILYFCDARWWEWHHERPEFMSHTGQRVTLENAAICALDQRVLALRNTGTDGIDTTDGCVRSGASGGYQALNLALNLGADPIFLLGYDMRAVNGITHWHGGHPVVHIDPRNTFDNLMRPYFEKQGGAADRCRELGVTVLNCTPGSALRAFSKTPLDEALKRFSLQET